MSYSTGQRVTILTGANTGRKATVLAPEQDGRVGVLVDGLADGAFRSYLLASVQPLVPASPPPPEAPSVAPGFLLVDAHRLAQLPTSTTAFSRMKAVADTWQASSTTPLLVNYIDPSTGVGKGSATLACALVFARTGHESHATHVRNVCRSIMGTERAASSNGTSSVDYLLAMARQISGYVLAADLVNYADPSWLAWLSGLRTQRVGTTTNKDTLVKTNMFATNWGAWASCSRIVIDAYLAKHDIAGARDDLAVAAERLKLFTGESRTGVWQKSSSFDASWAYVPAGWPVAFVPINPAGGPSGTDGVIVEDAARSAGDFPNYDKVGIDYSFHNLMAQMLAAQVLERQGYEDVWSWGDEALRRAMQRLAAIGDAVATGNGRSPARHVSYFFNAKYGLSLPTHTSGAGPSESFGFTDWLAPALTRFP